MTAEQRLRDRGIELPAVAKPVGAYVPAVRSGGFVFTAGQLPLRDGLLAGTGKVPSEVPLADAQQAARLAAMNALAAARSVLGSLDLVEQVVRVNVFVNSAAGFTDQAKVANGASELMLEVFAEAGRHTRCAVGVAELPLGSPVEVDLVLKVKS
jgi:enamine deaminase RidA (YjgF/YER057c/UK114 family)